MMTNRWYTSLVNAGQYPQDPAVPLDDPFVNAAGAIQNLLLEPCRSVALITSFAGAVRANHYHTTDWHYAYVLRGSLVYYWRPAGAEGPPNERSFSKGALFFTPPMVEHAMRFTEDSAIMTFARNVRDTEHHEADVVRVQLVQP